MRRGEDISCLIDGMFFIHQNVPERFVETHSHPEHHLFMPLRGSITLGLASTSWTVYPGQMAYLPSNLPHSFSSEENGEGERLICMLGDLQWKAIGARTREPSLLPASQLLKEIIFYLLLNRESSSAPALVSALVKSLDEQMESAGSGEQLALKKRIAEVRDVRLKTLVEHLQANYFNEISMSELPKLADVSARTMNRLFESELGLTPLQCLTRLRIEAACDLLAGQKMNVTDVAFEVGFGSLSRFIESFRAITGQLPSDYSRFGKKA